MAYSLETILAEKYETIIRRNITTTRMRGFYDLYILYKLKKDETDYRSLWEVYLGENKYIRDLTFDKVVDVVTIISNRINEM